jgi:ankyrin repeat protein
LKEQSQQNASGETPLHIVAKAGNIEIAKIILGKTSGFNSLATQDANGKTPLIIAVEKNNADLVREFTTSPFGREQIQKVSTNGDSVVTLLLEGQNYEVLSELFKYKQCKDLMLSQHHRDKVITLLLNPPKDEHNEAYNSLWDALLSDEEFRKSINAEFLQKVVISGNKNGKTYLLDKLLEHKEIRQFITPDLVFDVFKLNSNKANDDALVVRSLLGCEEGERALSQPMQSGRSVLMSLLKSAMLNEATIVLSYESGKRSVEISDTYDQGPLHVLNTIGEFFYAPFIETHFELLRQTLLYQDKDGNNPLHFEALYFSGKYNDSYFKNALFQLNKVGDTPLLSAIRSQNIARVEHLLRVVPEEVMRELLLVTDGDGKSPLHLAIDRGNQDIIKKITALDKPEEYAIENPEGLIPMEAAIKKGDKKLFAELYEHSPKPDLSRLLSMASGIKMKFFVFGKFATTKMPFFGSKSNINQTRIKVPKKQEIPNVGIVN